MDDPINKAQLDLKIQLNFMRISEENKLAWKLLILLSLVTLPKRLDIQP